MWELDYKESWVPKNWCFWTVVLEKTLESPLDCKEIQPVHPKGSHPEYSLEGLMLKVLYFGHLMWRTDSFEKTLMLGKIKGGRRRGRQRMRWLDGPTWRTWVWVGSGSWWCHPTISSSVVPFSSHLQYSQHQGLFQSVSSLHQVPKLKFQLQHQSF